MKIVIIGAGISGLSAYLSLTKHLPRPSHPASDHTYTIYEAHDTHKDTTSEQRSSTNLHSSTLIVGGALGIGPNGINVLKRLDPEIVKEIVSNGYAVSTYSMKSKNGSVLAQITSQALVTSANGESQKTANTVAISRHMLWRCLRIRVPDDIIINKRISEVIAKSDGRNIIRFADGSAPVEADLVIGADGLKSTTKKAVFPEVKGDIYPHQYEGLVGIGGFIPITPTLRRHIDKGCMNLVFGGNGFFGYFPDTSSLSSPARGSVYDVSEPGDQLAWWSTYAMEECPQDPRNIDRESVIRELQTRHASWKDPVVREIIRDKNLKIENVYPTWTAPEIPTWERDGVVLVGDAAHALPSTSGQGSSQAFEDVEALTLFLAHELHAAYGNPLETQIMTEKTAIAAASKKYVALRKPHVKQILDHARKMQNSKRNMSVVEEYTMYIFMWIMGWFPSVMSKQFRGVAEYDVRAEVEKSVKEA
ncbi:hypothetical protein BGW36DRAFT_306426 [Talaromyces proteolyticus]|uniref:FAD-binding domain-containing protein n=1 Tax=Talaromyces proteolyticus TaxID=1131652 RepID=A0AAD4PVL5_9EURO|nr:uncharacterized protein BGW36DRAFT_306426 [Talaromyces proteolyticus]KAH8690833.1 hypothetical protein BGW36DRAFT_306426 [Talaromyces proteolyticus]